MGWLRRGEPNGSTYLWLFGHAAHAAHHHGCFRALFLVSSCNPTSFLQLSVSEIYFFSTKCSETVAMKILLSQLASVETASCLYASLKTSLDSIFKGFFSKWKMIHIRRTTHTHWPDNREKDGSAADEVDQKEDLLPQIVFTGAFLCRLNDDEGDISQDLEDNRWVDHQNKFTDCKIFTHNYCFSCSHTPAEGWQSWRSSFPCQTGCI